MPAIVHRFELLEARARVFARTLPRLKAPEVWGSERAWAAARRLREVLPVLQLDGPMAEKLVERLRKMTRRLGAVRQTERLLALLDDFQASNRGGRPVVARLRNDVQRLVAVARADACRRRAGHDAQRLSDKLAEAVDVLRLEGRDRSKVRVMQWAVKARISRRAADLAKAINAAGSVYLARRLDTVHSALRKLRYGAELAEEIVGHVGTADVRALARMQTLLGRLDDLQALIERIRQVQGSLATPDLKAWRELDAVVVALETRCRGLHARYVRDRALLLALCERLGSRAPSDGSARRKVS